MFDDIKKTLYFKKTELLLSKGIKDNKIIPFDNEFYEELSHTIIAGLPASMHIKYLKPILPPGKCYDRSLFMFLSIKNSILVRANTKDLELKYGKENSGHGWIEKDKYVYDPSLMMRFDKDLYYEIYKPTNIEKCNKEEYCSIGDNLEFYNDIKYTTVEDYKPNGKKRIELLMSIPLTIAIAQNSNNQEFINELNEYLETIDYDEEEINNELNEAIKNSLHNKKNYINLM